MAATKQSQAIQVGNKLIGVGQQLLELSTQISSASTAYTQLTLGDTFAAMATAPVKADGSLDAVDANPNVANPIDTRVYTGLTRAISANDLASLNTLLSAVSLLLSGSAVSQQGQAPQLLNKISGG